MRNKDKRKLPDNIAIEVMKDINKKELRTSAICEKYKEYGLKPWDVYNMVHKDYYIELRDYV